MAHLPKAEMTWHENLESRTQPGFSRFVFLASPLLAISVFLAFVSDGCYHDDDLTHYIMAREAGIKLIDIWGRPGFTVPYAAVGWVGNTETGWLMCRLLTVAIVGATAWFTGDVARRLRLQQPELAVLVFLTIPLSFLLSFTTLTESICALYLIVGTWLLITNRNWESAFFWSVAMTTRHEAIVYLVPVGLYFLWRRELVAAILLGWAEAVWNAVSWWEMGYDYLPCWRYIERPGEAGYGSGTVFTGLQMWIGAVGPGVAAAALIGAILFLVDIWRELRSQYRQILCERFPQWQRAELPSANSVSASTSDQDHALGTTAISRTMGTLIVVGGGLGTVALQTVLYMYNGFASGGYARFLVPGAPWMAICAAAGLQWLWSIAFATSKKNSTSHGSAWNACVAHLGIALVGGAIIAVSMQSVLMTYVQPLTLFFLLIAASGLAIAASKFRLNQVVAVVYLLLLVTSGVAWGLELKPFRKTPNQKLAAEAKEWIRNSTEYRGRNIMTNSLWFSYSWGLPPWCEPDEWAAAPADTLLLYEIHDESLDSTGWLRVPQDQFSSRAVRTWMSADSPGAEKPFLVLFEKLPPTDAN